MAETEPTNTQEQDVSDLEMGPVDGVSKKDALPQEDFADLDIVQQILVSGTPEQLERLRAFHNLTEDQLKRYSHYATMRKKVHTRRNLDQARRELNNPLPTDEELSMGVFAEGIEEQVRNAVLTLRSKGYSTYESGFLDPSGLQGISFEEPLLEGYVLPTEIEQSLRSMGIQITIRPNGIRMSFDRHMELEEIRQAWDRVVKEIPDLHRTAPPSALPAAVSFRDNHSS